MEVGIVYVFVAAVITAVATGLGALPFVFVRNISSWWLGVANAAAGGLMLGASHSLIAEGTKLAPDRVLIGILLGLAAISSPTGSFAGAAPSTSPTCTATAPPRRC